MTRLGRIARSAGRRSAAGAFLVVGGPAMTAGAAVGLALVAAAKVLPADVAWWWLAFPPIAAAGALTAAVAAVRRPRPLDAAVRVDQTLGLRDQFASGVAFARNASAGSGDTFERLAIARAEATAGQVDLRRGLPLRMTGWWGVWPVLLAAAVAAAVVVPARASPRAAREAVLAREKERAVEVAATVADLTQRAESITPPSAARAEQLAALEEIRAQLESGALTAEEGRSRAAEELQRLASAADQTAEAARLERDALRRELSKLRPSEAEADDPAAALREAMASGDMAAAAQAADELTRGLDRMSEPERKGLADDLRELASRIEDAAAETAARSDEASEDDPLRSQGLTPEQVDSLRSADGEEAVRERLEDMGVDPATSQRMAEEIARENEERRAAESAREQARDLAEEMRQAADEVEETPKEGEAGSEEQQPGDTGRFEPTPGAQKPDSGREGQPGKEGDKSVGQTPINADKPEQQGGEPDQPGGPDNKTGPAPTPQAGGEPQQPGDQPPDKPGGGQQQPAAGSQGEDKPAKPGAPGQGSPGEQPGEGMPGAPPAGEGEEAGESDQEHDGDPGNEGPGAGSGMSRGTQRLAERLSELSRGDRLADDRQREAEQYRDLAREMMESATEEERQRWRQWAEAMRHTDPERLPPSAPYGPIFEDPVDAHTAPEDLPRSARGPQRVVAEWLGDGSGDPTADQTRQGRGVLRDAARSAERAVEDRTLPPRYDSLIRRYYRRLPDRVLPAPTGDQR